MTDRLRTLLHDEVESLEIPPVPATDILGTGRRLRRRRTGTIWASAVLAVAVVAGGTAAARSGGDDHSAPPVTDTPAPPEPGTLAWSLDDLVYVVQDGRLIAGTQVPEVAQTLYYTSAGILVRTNRDGSSDGGAPFHFRLIGHDGELSPVNVTLGEVVPSTDSAEPYLAWATQEGGRIQVVVHDVVSGHDVGRVDVPGTFTWGGWEAPPVALSGDLVYVATDDQTAVVNWRTGEVTTTAVVPAGQVPEVSGGRAVTVNRGSEGRLGRRRGRGHRPRPARHPGPARRPGDPLPRRQVRPGRQPGVRPARPHARVRRRHRALGAAARHPRWLRLDVRWRPLRGTR